ncbi:UNVERIFIED_CONTAM: hypothetical protein FKN15_027037 [Acipenser sinensis]
MAAPILASRAGSVNNTGTGTGSGTSISSNNNNKTAPSFPELDFRSGARIEELNKLILDFSKNDQREYDDQRALEIHTAKDFIFSMLAMDIHQLYGKLHKTNMWPRSAVTNYYHKTAFPENAGENSKVCKERA